MGTMPLVSVGIPTYNRPAGLQRTLEQITGQTYRHLEIIISDNCSPDPEVERVARAFSDKDPRIQYIRQTENIGPANNFKFVLARATGSCFMWAADDDQWQDFYIERLVETLDSLDETYVAANFEAQYFDESGQILEFFAEGKPFYSFYSNSVLERLKQMLAFNYGNLIYSLYRTKALKSQQLVFYRNEIPTFLQVACQGNWKVLPEVGFFKQAHRATYKQARWEKQGGILWRIPTIAETKRVLSYHRAAIENIEITLASLPIAESDRILLKKFAQKAIWRHFFALTFRFKGKQF